MENDKTGTDCGKVLAFDKKTWKDNVAFVVEGKRLYAAKNVLAMVSPVFERMFSSSFEEKDKEEIILPEKKFYDFHEFLQCMYPTSTRSIDKENVFIVLPLANEYQVADLMEKCATYLIEYLEDHGSELTSKDIMKIYYQCGFYYGNKLIREYCVHEMSLRSKLTKEDVKDLTPDVLLQFQNDVFAHFGQMAADFNTRYVKSLITNTKRLIGLEKTADVEGFENAIGASKECVIDDIFDLSLNDCVCSREVLVWDLKFHVRAAIYQDYEKYLAVYLVCSFPERNKGWSCQVNTLMSLSVATASSDKTVVRKNEVYTITDRAYEACDKNFCKMSKLLEELKYNDDDDGKSVKIAVDFLVKKPVHAQP